MRLDGLAIDQASPRELARVRNGKIGFVFQFFNLLPKLNVRQNVELPMVYGGVSGRERRERALRVLQLVDMENRARHRPMQLSGGQQQRAAIARALVNNPRIVFADEPTGNLDSHTGETILRLFHALSQQGRTIALVTHDPEIATVTPRRIEIRDGKIASNMNRQLAETDRNPWCFTGTWASTLDIWHFVVAHGRMINEVGDREARNVCVIGTAVRDAVFGSPEETGREINPVGEFVGLRQAGSLPMAGQAPQWTANQNRCRGEINRPPHFQFTSGVEFPLVVTITAHTRGRNQFHQEIRRAENGPLLDHAEIRAGDEHQIRLHCVFLIEDRIVRQMSRPGRMISTG